MSKQNYLLVSLIIVSISLIISTLTFTSIRGAVLNYEASKNNMLTLDLTYSELITSMQYNSKKYLKTGDSRYKDEFYKYKMIFTQREKRLQAILPLGFDTEISPGLILSDTLSYTEVPTSPSDDQIFVFDDYEQAEYHAFITSFTAMVEAMDQAIQENDVAVFYSENYLNNLEQIYTHLVNYTNHYLGRINAAEAPAMQEEAFLSLFTPIMALLTGILSAIVMIVEFRKNKENAYFRKLFRETLDKANIGVAIFTYDTHYEYANDMYKDLMEIPTVDPVGKTPHDILSDALLEALPRKGIKNYQTPVLCLPRQGGNKYVAYTRFEIVADKNETKVVTVIRDCTESVEMDAQLNKQLADIEFYASAKDSFIANVSHEIKTPLNAIIGMVHILQNTELSDRQRSLVGKVSTASDLLLNILNDVLDFSKIKKGLKLYPTDLNLLSLLNDVEGIFRPTIEGKDLIWTTTYNFEPSLCLNIDKTRLSQVLINLLNNACKFTTQGGINLSVDVMERQEENISLQFCVSDTGLGIDPLDLPKLFQEFEQLENHLTKQHQGTGLGLSICKNIAESMGGTIWAESQRDSGSKFYFTVKVKQASAEFTALDSIGPSLPPLNGEGKKVLIVEDTEINFEVIQTLLAEANITCDHASDGIEALSICENMEQDEYKLILMDIHMPRLDGYTASRILKTEMKVETPILALTATNVEDETKEEYQGIIDGFILKPYKCADLYMALYPYFHPELISSFPSSAMVIATSEYSEDLSQDPFCGRTEAIENLGGMENLYTKHLEKFQINYKDMGSEIEKIIASGDMTEARRLVHSVKGLAGTLGLIPLQRASIELEEAILSGEEKLLPLIITFENKLQQVCQARINS